MEGNAARTVEMEAFEVLTVRRGDLAEADLVSRVSEGSDGRGGGIEESGSDRRF